MERLKTFILTLLVILSLFLSYKLLYRPTTEEVTETTVDTYDIFSYKRLYHIKPNREYLDSLPSDEINYFLLKSIMDAERYDKLYNEWDDKYLDEKGYFVEAGFDIPLQGIFRSFQKSLPKLKFNTIKNFYFVEDKNSLYLTTDDGVYLLKTKERLNIPPSERYVEFDNNFLPKFITGVNEFAVSINPVLDYSRSERYNFSEEFLRESSLAEIEEENGWLYSSSSSSLYIGKDGNIIYRHRPEEHEVFDLFETLLNLKKFIKESPLNFSSYRIIDLQKLEDSDEDLLIYLTEDKLPQLRGENAFIEVRTYKNNIVYFNYNACYTRKYNELYRAPDVTKYKKLIESGLDPFLIYKKKRDSDSNIVTLDAEIYKK